MELPEPPKLEVNSEELNKLLDDVVEFTRSHSLVALERLYVEIEAVVARYSKMWDRKGMTAEVRNAVHI